MMDLSKLYEPFHAADIEWRVGQAGESNGKVWAKVLCYVTARAIQDRLDEVCGQTNWYNEFREGPGGGVLCGLSIRVGDEWITKWNGAENTDIEAVKGGLSGAEKRAAVEWGIGRYLYKLEEDWANVHENGKHRGKTKEGKWFRWDPPALPDWALPNGASLPPRSEVPRKEPAARTPEPAKSAVTGDVPPCPRCGGKVWDNRTDKRSPKAPDFKCRDKKCDGAVWLDSKKPKPIAAGQREANYDSFEAPFPDADDDLPF